MEDNSIFIIKAEMTLNKSKKIIP